MSFDRPRPPTTTERGIRVALIFALAAERLHPLLRARQVAHRRPGHEPGRRLAGPLEAPAGGGGAAPAGGPRATKLARQIEGSVSREAGLFISHEMNEALDPTTSPSSPCR